MFDTIEKRASTIGLGLPFRLTLPWANADIDEQARVHVSGSYAVGVESVITGYFCWEAFDAFSPGIIEASSFAPGLEVVEDFAPGLLQADAFMPGFDQQDDFAPGFEAGMGDC